MPIFKGLYIAFEGGEACGKSTQAKLLANKIGPEATLTHEPGGTHLGTMLREILLAPDRGNLNSMTEALLMTADRAEHMVEVVFPQLEKRGHVITDRTFISSIAYQGAARGLGEQRILELNLLNTGLILPNLVLIMGDLTKEEKLKRMSLAGVGPDRIEAAGRDFHTKVAESFGRMADTLANDSRTESIKTIYIEQEDKEGQRSIASLHEEVCERVEDYCKESGVAFPI